MNKTCKLVVTEDLYPIHEKGKNLTIFSIFCLILTSQWCVNGSCCVI